jgi:hypothetical protein
VRKIANILDATPRVYCRQGNALASGDSAITGGRK